MNASQLRQKYLDFMVSKGHKIIPPAPLIPPDDPTTLFTNCGMQQLIPYLKGETHPMGVRLVDSQPSFRTEDIEEIGDNRHTTFFEMLGNWSLGDYFKQEQLSWFWEFLTKIVGLESKNLYASVFSGNSAVPRDEESIKIWQGLFKTNKAAVDGEKGFDPNTKIYTYPAEKNWWSRAGIPTKMPAGEIGGPDSEVFFDFGAHLKLHEQSRFKNQPCHLNCDCGRFLEIGNSVFMQYEKQKDGSLKPLPKKNVDFGGGLERILAASQNSPDVFKTDLFSPVIKKLEELTKKSYAQEEAAMRVISDHMRAAVFIINEGVEPANKLQGYILRRLIRRAAVKLHPLGQDLTTVFTHISAEIIKIYQDPYFKNKAIQAKMNTILKDEMEKFSRVLAKGLKEIDNKDPKKIDAKFCFFLYQSYGFPFEIIKELLHSRGYEVDQALFNQEFVKHQKLSRTASAGMFKGGLADHSEEIVKLHTATHLLHASLRQILGSHVKQSGSNITSDRLRFDFTHPQPLTPDQIKKIETLVNTQIKKNLPVNFKVMTLKEAQKQGALAFFGQKYPDKVKVYKINSFSLEVCGGPHVSFTGALGVFRIIKEESCGAGKRRIYAKLENGPN